MKKLLTSAFLVLMLAGCSTQDVALEEGMLDAGEFTISAPEGWVYTPLVGMDSIVGEFSNSEMTLRYDYGVHTGDFVNNSVYFEDPSAYTVMEETIHGLSAKIYIPNDTNSDKPTVLFIAHPMGVGPCTEGVCASEENFQMLGDDLTVEQVDVALEIFRTVDFTERN